MGKTKHRPEEFVAKLRDVDVLLDQEQSVGEAVKSIAGTETTYHRGHNDFSGLEFVQVRRRKELEAENSRLRRALSDLTLDKEILNAVLHGLQSRLRQDDPE